MSKFLLPKDALEKLLTAVTTLHISSIRADGSPNISYAPYVRDDDGHFYVFISELASHTEDLLNNAKVSIMLVADEQDTQQIFARTRLTYVCYAEEVKNQDQNHQKILALMEDKFGGIINILRDLPDFILMRLIPKEGRFVMGFGQAYVLDNEAQQGLRPINKKE